MERFYWVLVAEDWSGLDLFLLAFVFVLMLFILLIFLKVQNIPPLLVTISFVLTMLLGETEEALLWFWYKFVGIILLFDPIIYSFDELYVFIIAKPSLFGVGWIERGSNKVVNDAWYLLLGAFLFLGFLAIRIELGPGWILLFFSFPFFGSLMLFWIIWLGKTWTNLPSVKTICMGWTMLAAEGLRVLNRLLRPQNFVCLAIFHSVLSWFSLL